MRELLLRLVCLLVAEALGALPSLTGSAVGLLVEAATGPLVDLFLTLGEGLVRLVAESLHVHADHLLRRSKPPSNGRAGQHIARGRNGVTPVAQLSTFVVMHRRGRCAQTL